MIYENVCPAKFIDRPNRFIAHILLNGRTEVAHVKNTGRCRELLISGADVIVRHDPSPKRKTAYDLIAVYKGDRLINMDANAPNTVFGEWLAAGGMGYVPELIRPEQTHGDSRFDFFFRHGGASAFAEVKGVTLEQDGIVRFPDAPTQRGVKHLRGLMRCVDEGLEAYAVFIVQMKGVQYLEPNRAMHPEFADALREAVERGVKLLALDCLVTEASLKADAPVEVRLV